MPDVVVLTGFAYHRPESGEEFGGLVRELGSEARILAGGTDLVVQMRNGRLRPRHVIDIGALPGINLIEEQDGFVRIAAGARVRAVVTRAGASDDHRALVEGGSTVGSVQIQNRATIAGNICNASPAADTVPALLAFRAVVNVAGPEPRSVPLDEFLIGPGRTALQAGEWVGSLDLPRIGPNGSCYLKLGRTRGVDLAVVGVACAMTRAQASLGFASVAPTAFRIDIDAPGDDGELPQEAADALADRLRPIDDVRASADYRRSMALLLARRAWRLAYERLRAMEAA
ncbi:MAG: FAD binding domain-containing protein [Chloroflexota bacterium]